MAFLCFKKEEVLSINLKGSSICVLGGNATRRGKKKKKKKNS